MELRPREHSQWQAAEKSCFRDHFLSLKVKGKRAVFPILILSRFFSPKEEEGERFKRERSPLSVAFHSAGKGIALVATAWVCLFWPILGRGGPTAIHGCPLLSISGNCKTQGQLCTLSNFLMRQSQKFKIVIPPFIQ